MENIANRIVNPLNPKYTVSTIMLQNTDYVVYDLSSHDSSFQSMVTPDKIIAV